MKQGRASVRKYGTYAVASAAAVGGLKLLQGVVKRAARHRRSKGETIQLGSHCLQCAPDHISLLSLNALAPNLVSKQRYKYVRAGCLSWPFRFKRLCSLLEKVSVARASCKDHGHWLHSRAPFKAL